MSSRSIADPLTMHLPGITHAALLQALRRQLDGGTVPEVRQTYDRLRQEGCDHAASLDLLAGTLRQELEQAAQGGGEYQAARYATRLAELHGPNVGGLEPEGASDEGQD